MDFFFAGTFNAHGDREQGGPAVPHLFKHLQASDVHLSTTVKNCYDKDRLAWNIPDVGLGQSKVEILVGSFVDS